MIVALMLTSAYVAPSDAAESTLAVTISPDVAYYVREWRRAHGLPQEAEVASPDKLADGGGAVEPALRLIGIADQSPDDLRISVMQVGAHWRVFVESLSDNRRYVVDVADSIAQPTHF